MTVLLTMSTDWPTFNCPAWFAEAARYSYFTGAIVCRHFRGSSNVEVQLSSVASADTLMQAFASGSFTTSGGPISATRAGVVVTPPSGVSIGLIVGCVLGGLALLALIVLLIICLVRRHRNKSSRSSYYVPLQEERAVAAVAAPPAALSPRAASQQHVTCRLAHDVVDTGEGILAARAGEIAFLQPEDYAGTSEWVWATVGLNSGYVPRAYLQRM